jgi:formamidopyrimidine-DNA glycosylase
MPELPDVQLYVEALDARLTGATLEKVVLASPFLLRSVDPPISAVRGKKIEGFRRIGKRIIWDLDDDLFLVVHLMVAGRFHWKKAGTKPAGRIGLCAFEFSGAKEPGSLHFTEAGTKKRASLYVVRGEAALDEHRRGGAEPLEIDVATYAAQLRKENHTLKRSLTDPRLFSGIGNAYSDEILHRAKLSPVKLSQKLTDDEIERLHAATREILTWWIDHLRKEDAGKFPEKVTAFRPEMAVHGKYNEPCPVCGTKVQRIVHAENETNYCPRCQTEGKLLSDRALSVLLKQDWPKTIEELEERQASRA